MGRINVEGLGVVEIAGDEPTTEELNVIKNNYKKIVTDNQTAIPAEKATDDFLSSPSFGRLLAEVGFGIAGSIATGGLAAPALAVRAGFLARPFLVKFGQSILGSAAGSATGAGVSQVFDPKDSVVREMVRAGLEGAVAEGVGTPAVAGISKFVINPVSAKYFSKGPKAILEEIEGAGAAERAIAAEAKRIQAEPGKYAKLIPGKTEAGDLTEKNIEAIKKIAETAEQRGLTTAVKTDSRTFDILELITEKSLIGGGRVVGSKEAASKVADGSLFRLLDEATLGLKNADVGNFYLDTLANSDKAFRASSNAFYKAVDTELTKSGIAGGKVIPKENIKNIIDEQVTYLAGRSTPVNRALSDIEKLGDRLSFQETSAFMRSLNDDIAEAFAKGRRAEGKALLTIKESTEKLLDNPELVPASVRQAQLTANKFYKDGAKIFNDGLIEKLLTKGDPDTVFQTIVQGGTRPSTVKKTFNEIDRLTTIDQKILNEQGELITKLGDKGQAEKVLSKEEAETLKDRLRGQFLTKMVDASKSANPVYGEFFNAKKFADQLSKFKDTSDQLFTKDQLNNLKNIENMMNFAQDTVQRRGGLPGGLFIQLKQAGAATQVGVAALQFGGGAFSYMSSESYLPAATILLGPLALSRMLTSKSINNFLFKEYSKENLGKMSTAKAGVVFRQLLGRMADEGIINSEEYTKYSKQSKEVEDNLISKGIKSSKDLQNYKAVPTQQQQVQQVDLKPINTNITSPNINMIAQQSKPQTLPQVPAAKPVAGGITNIPQERIDQYTNLFGRI